jgi:preprotein translocase subunit SecD
MLFAGAESKSENPGASCMPSELEELKEHAEDGKEHPALAPVTLTMAILAVLVATVSLLGHRSSTEEIILQNKVTDQWGYYQAKNIRQHTDELFADLAGVIASKDAEAAAKVQEKYRGQVDRYKDDKKELETKARELEQEFHRTHQKTDRFDLGEVFLEVALVITSITLLSGRRSYWYLGLIFGVAGLAIALSAHLIH